MLENTAVRRNETFAKVGSNILPNPGIVWQAVTQYYESHRWDEILADGYVTATSMAMSSGIPTTVLGKLKAMPLLRYDVGAMAKSSASWVGQTASRGYSRASQALSSLTARVRMRPVVETPDIAPLFGRGPDGLFGMCFLAGTLVHAQDGVKPIEHVRVGDFVAARNQYNKETQWRPVLQIFATPEKDVVHVEVEHPDGARETISCTTQHPFYVVDRGWCGADSLLPGDSLELLDGGRSTVVGIAADAGKHTVYNFEVADDHTYFVGNRGVWVHNASSILGAIDIDKYDFGAHLKNLIGDAPKGMPDPHAHHILFKKGLGAKQQALVVEGQALLRKYDIDPIFGKENLVWAPNRIKGQHSYDALEHVVSTLKQTDEMFGTLEEMIKALKRLGKTAAQRR